MEPDVEVYCKKEKCKKNTCSCLNLIAAILAIALSFFVGVLVSAITAIIDTLAIGAIIALVVVFAILLIVTIISIICCKKENNQKYFC